MSTSEEAVSQLLTIQWASRAGQPTGLAGVRQILDKDAFITSIDSIAWENTTLDARNDITGYLATQHSNDDQRWNVMAQKVGKTIDDELIPLLPPSITDDSRVLNSVKWDVMAFLMEDIYKDKIKMPLFFKSLIGVYEAGHIPCGWDGEWPKGRLVVY